MKIIDFFTDKKKIHQALFILPLITFYLTKSPMWLFFAGLAILAIMEVYKTDLEGKIKVMMKNRLKQKDKNKPLLRNWKDQINDAGKEFDYIYSWKFFAVISIIFIVEFIYSTVISYNYSKILFGVHIFMIIYFIFLDLMINHNFNLLSKSKRKKK
ncbi:MAG: hypothetical protein WC812_01970 [Candidatus Pacearchaeota archaeon]|jgi:hypothetical protein